MFKDKYFIQEQYLAISKKEMSVNSNRKWNFNENHGYKYATGRKTIKGGIKVSNFMLKSEQSSPKPETQ